MSPPSLTKKIMNNRRHIPRDGKKEPADFKRIVDILGEANYRGYLVLEYESGDPFGEIPKYLAKLREAITQ